MPLKINEQNKTKCYIVPRFIMNTGTVFHYLYNSVSMPKNPSEIQWFGSVCFSLTKEPLTSRY